MRLCWIAALAALTASAPAATHRAPRCSGPAILGRDPGDRLQLMDDFRAALPPRDRRRLDVALPRDPDGGITRCDGIARSRASCESAAYPPALRATGLMPRFLATACGTGGRAASPAKSRRKAGIVAHGPHGHPMPGRGVVGE